MQPCGRIEGKPKWKGLVASYEGVIESYKMSTMKDGIANNSTASISQARKSVEQLKMEACMDRIKVSKAAADLMAYCDAHIREDPLIIPVPASENPFREKKFFCNIL
ncbi:Guanine nucleotide-binding protein G(I)/G(S)/G(O) subunit gamma-4 [Dissostichus eleginoides]|nr:Guanine nucleotide-binding protein G(I)/G(S)/G(O) subunit gamma-4 [Dissostichus eleginoides]